MTCWRTYVHICICYYVRVYIVDLTCIYINTCWPSFNGDTWSVSVALATWDGPVRSGWEHLRALFLKCQKSIVVGGREHQAWLCKGVASRATLEVFWTVLERVYVDTMISGTDIIDFRCRLGPQHQIKFVLCSSRNSSRCLQRFMIICCLVCYRKWR